MSWHISPAQDKITVPPLNVLCARVSIEAMVPRPVLRTESEKWLGRCFGLPPKTRSVSVDLDQTKPSPKPNISRSVSPSVLRCFDGLGVHVLA